MPIIKFTPITKKNTQKTPKKHQKNAEKNVFKCTLFCVKFVNFFTKELFFTNFYKYTVTQLS